MRQSENRDRAKDTIPNTPLTDCDAVTENPELDSQEEVMEWKCLEDKRSAGDWRVEAIDFDDEGKVYVAIFSGPSAQARAEEYAEFKNTARHLQAA